MSLALTEVPNPIDGLTIIDVREVEVQCQQVYLLTLMEVTSGMA